MVLVPPVFDNIQLLDQVKNALKPCHFGSFSVTTAPEHDRMIAFTSQLCHVLASCLVDSAENSDVTQFGGGSFEDLTRIAMINAPLWTELFLANKNELLSHIESFENSLTTLKNFIKNDDAKGCESYLENVRTKRLEMSRIDVKNEN